MRENTVIYFALVIQVIISPDEQLRNGWSLIITHGDGGLAPRKMSEY